MKNKNWAQLAKRRRAEGKHKRARLYEQRAEQEILENSRILRERFKVLHRWNRERLRAGGIMDGSSLATEYACRSLGFPMSTEWIYAQLFKRWQQSYILSGLTNRQS